MVAISLYRGNLHRVPDAPREWPMPPRKITLEQFKILTQKRAQALARLAAQNNPKSNGTKEESNEPTVKQEEPQAVKVEEPQEEEGELKTCSVFDPQLIQVDPVPKPEDCTMMDVDAGSIANSLADAKMEVNNNLDALSETEKRKIEVEKKLQVLNEKKHHLVQMLKQILSAEEEIKRRNAQSVTSRSAAPLQSETAVDMGSATSLVPKLSVEVNFSGELGGESDAAANHSTCARQMHRMLSTSTASLSRPFQQNELLPTPRSTVGSSGHGQTQTRPSTIVGNASASAAAAAVTASPSRFAPNGHHHSASLPPVSGSGSHFMVSSPSPVASGGASSVFKDTRLTTSS